jgi:peptide/nickel transport system substrate-binding protein
VRFARNPRFRSGSALARPDGYPDAIDVSFTDDPAARVAAVRDGEADAVAITGVFSGLIPPAMAHRLWLTDAPHIHTAPAAVTVFLFLNVHAAPFDDRRVRQALNYAFDRRRVVELVGEGLAGESCQVLPPGLPGYVPTCPYTLDPTPAGTWSAPDLESARRLVAASGTRGAAIQIWAHTGQWDNVVRYAVQVLRRLGYRVRLREIGPPNDLGPYSTYVNDPRHHAQAGFAGWVDDYLTASSFFEPFSCAARGPGAYDPSQFCAPSVDAEARRAVAAGEPAADARWSALDRRLLAAAPLVPLFTPREAVLVSDRVGNVQIQPALGPLLDQMWVR